MPETFHEGPGGELPGRGTRLPRIGGALGIAGTMIGMGIFVLGCFGMSAAFYLSPVPLALGTVGLILALCGIFFRKIDAEDSHVTAALIINVAVIAGALIELMIMLGKPIFAVAGR